MIKVELSHQDFFEVLLRLLTFSIQYPIKIFKLFSSIKDEKRKINVNGIGLGLVISRMIVGKFQGEINFNSTYKQGSTFFFTFEHVEYSDNELGQFEIIP